MMNRAFSRLLPFLMTALLLAGLSFAGLRAGAASSLLTPVTADFTAAEAAEYANPRGTILQAGDVPFKIYDSQTAVRNENGLTLPNGYLTIQKNNPLENYGGFRVEIRYSADETKTEPAANQAFLVMSAKSYGSTPALTDPLTLLGIAENGEIYVNGAKAAAAKSNFGLTPLYASVQPGAECLLTVSYMNGQLSVSFTTGGKTTALLNDYSCTIAGVRQFTLGADKTTANRLSDITWKDISFAEYGEYVPQDAANIKAVVQVGTTCTEFTDLSSAFSLAKSTAKAGTYSLMQFYDDWKVGSPIIVDANTSMAFDLNGHTIDRGLAGYMHDEGSVFWVREGASLTIMDSSPDAVHENCGIKGGILTGGAGDDFGGGIVLEKNSHLTMTGGSVVACVTNDHGGGIRVTGDNVRIYVENAGFYTNMTLDSLDNCHGGAVYVDGDKSRAEFRNTIFEGNYSEDDGGAIYMNDGRLVVMDCTFTDNSCLDDGGAIYYETGSNSNMERCVFLRNRAGTDGGAIYCNTGEETKISGLFRENKCGDQGGAIHINGGSVGIVDCEITENKAKTGGGIYVDEFYDLNVQGLVNITGNLNTSNGKDNVFLDSVGPAEAHIYSGGLYEGSAIGVRVNSSNHTVCENISEYQKRYLTSDQGKTLKFSPDSGKLKTEYLISSVIGKGRLPYVLLGGAVLVLLAVLFVIRGRKRRKGGKKDA